VKICIAQTESLKGDIQLNLQNHYRFIERAMDLGSDFIAFPELSITAYEPGLAQDLACTLDSSLFKPLQQLSDKGQISIGVGMPTLSADGICISMLIFQPLMARTVYSKQLLHADELAYFSAGKEQKFLDIKGKKIAVGICYETLQRAHFIRAKEGGADIYIASVAKPLHGIQKAYQHFPRIANEFNTPVLMANSIGFCDNFLAGGQSAVWNQKGELLQQLDGQNQGLLLYNSELESAQVHLL
jgi:predicted amidohydrolase